MGRITRGQVLNGNGDEVFDKLWKEFHIDAVRTDGGTKVTPSYTSKAMMDRLNASQKELQDKGLEDGMIYRGLTKRALVNAEKQIQNMSDEEMEKRQKFVEGQKQNIVDSNIVEDSVPLVYDPEVLQILKQEAPFAYGSLNREGQQGFKAVFNVVNERQDPIGRVSESDAINLDDQSKDFGLSKETEEMVIYVDKATISDFSATASEHYLSLQDLAIGTRMAVHGQFHEQECFYGYRFTDSRAGTLASDYPENSPVGKYSTYGLATWFAEAGNMKDKSSVTDNFLEDLKSEVTELLQGKYAVNPNNLEIWTSHDMYDKLENELTGIARIDAEGNVNYGNYTIQVKGVPIRATHNIDNHTYEAGSTDGNDIYSQLISNDFDDSAITSQEYDHASPGDNGDVFIVNTQTTRYRELTPLTSFPLGRRGASSEIGLMEYGAMIEKSLGNFGKYLRGYGI